MGAVYCFDRFTVDERERRLLADGQPVEISGRYFDVLLLLLAQHGRLVSRDQLLDTVWAGIPVTDEALSQAIAQLRRALGDSPARPAFIETVPKQGYRFIAEVGRSGSGAAGAPHSPTSVTFAESATIAGAATAGGAAAGALGGLVYGLAAASDRLQPAIGSTSFLLVLVASSLLAGLLGGLGVGAGLAAGRRVAAPLMPSVTAGAALGGLLVGGLVELVGIDALMLILGRAPDAIGGAFEGLVLGAAVGLGSTLRLGGRGWPNPAGAAIVAAAAGAILPLLGGHLMAGSLDRLTATYPGSRLDMDPLGRWFGEAGFGPISASAFSAFEGLLFGAGVALAVRLALAAADRSRR